MKKILLLAFGCLIALPSWTQTSQQARQFKIAEVFENGNKVTYQNLVTKVIAPKDGMKISFKTPPDTARLFIPDDGFEYILEGTFRKVEVTIPTPTPTPSVVIPAISFLTSLSSNVFIVGTNMVPNANGGGTAVYTVSWKAGKLKMRYAMAPGGIVGTVTLKYGTTTKTVTIPPTAGWGTYADLEIDVIAFSGNASFQFNRGLNVPSFTTP